MIKINIYNFLSTIILLPIFTGHRIFDYSIGSHILKSVYVGDFIFLFISIVLLLRNRNYFYNFFTRKRYLVYLFIPIFGFLSSTLFLSGENYLLLSFLFAIRDLEIVLIFFMSLYIFQRSSEGVNKIFQIYSILTLAYFAYDISIGGTGFYYVGQPLEKGSAQVGIVSMLITSFYFLTLQRRKAYTGNLCISITWFLISALTFSRTALLGYFGFIIFFIMRKKNYKNTVITLLIIILIYVALYMSLNFFEYLLSRFDKIHLVFGDRLEKVMQLITKSVESKYALFFGHGYNSPNELVLGSNLGTTLSVDNGFVRRIFEVGLVGLLCQLIFIFGIVREGKLSLASDKLVVFTFVCCFLFTNLTIESFQLYSAAYGFAVLSGYLIAKFTGKLGSDNDQDES